MQKTDLVYIISEYLATQLGDQGFDLSPLQSLSQSDKATARLANWNVISELIEQVRARKHGAKPPLELLDSATKNLLVAHDEKTFHRLFAEIQQVVDCSLDKENVLPERNTHSVGAISFGVSLNHNPHSSYDSALSFILGTLTDALSLPNIKQAAAFLTSNNQFLEHACVKGLKGGDYGKVARWYKILETNVQHLVAILDEDPGSFDHVFSAIACGINSRNFEVAERCCKVLGQLLLTGELATLETYDLSFFTRPMLNHYDLLAPISQLILSRLYANKYAMLVQEIFLLSDEQQDLVPEVLAHCGIKDDLHSLQQLILIVLENFEENTLFYLKLLLAAWQISPALMDSQGE